MWLQHVFPTESPFPAGRLGLPSSFQWSVLFIAFWQLEKQGKQQEKQQGRGLQQEMWQESEEEQREDEAFFEEKRGITME